EQRQEGPYHRRVLLLWLRQRLHVRHVALRRGQDTSHLVWRRGGHQAINRIDDWLAHHLEDFQPFGTREKQFASIEPVNGNRGLSILVIFNPIRPWQEMGREPVSLPDIGRTVPMDDPFEVVVWVSVARVDQEWVFNNNVVLLVRQPVVLVCHPVVISDRE